MKIVKLVLALCLELSTFGQVETLKHNADQARQKLLGSQKNPERRRMDYTTFVNPFVGTGGHGHTYPGAVAPFGMIQLGPDTRYNGWDGCSGYHYSDSVIYGFSHTHLSGTGVEDLCDLLIVPQQGKLNTKPGYLNKKGYGMVFRHADEQAAPGYYAVKFQKEAIQVKLAATERAGIHEYTFEKKKGKKYILIDLDHRDKIIACDVQVLDKNKVQGHRSSDAWARKQEFYFHLESELPFTKAKLVSSNKLMLEYPASTMKIILKVGISAVDCEGARKNLLHEIPHFDLEMVKVGTHDQWLNELGKISFATADKKVMQNFYTALYHSYICPSIFSDVDGRYRGNDQQIHLNPTKKRYTTFSIWDTYRATHPLFTLVQQERTNHFIQTFLDIFSETGELPVWELWGNETDCMIGYHAASVINDAWQKGIRKYDSRLALRAMMITSSKNELGKTPYRKQGFIGSDQEPESVSKTLEYAYDDWNIALLAEALGNNDSAMVFKKRSYAFVNLLHPKSKFMQPRRGALWVPGFNPSEVNFNFTEANSWQYSLYVPQHIGAFSKLIGGADSLEYWLDQLFSTSSTLDGRNQADITGLIGQYAHGNEPSHHMAYLYNYTNHPEKTQAMVLRIMDELYQPSPDGLSGNEDCGQMSAWYVLSALGIYPISPGSSKYEIGRPMMESGALHLENGKSFYISVQNNGPKTPYIQEIWLNGRPYKQLYLEHDTIMAGGQLHVVMGSYPNRDLKNWERAAPLSMDLPDQVVPVPSLEVEQELFQDSLLVSISHLRPEKYRIVYTTDGSEPYEKSKTYKQPFVIRQTTTLKIKALLGNYSSATVEAKLRKTDPNLHLKLDSKYANQYAASGPMALIDGLKAGNDFRSGAWQGYEGTDLKGEISFDQSRVLKGIRFSCLQDIKSWIFMPEFIRIEYSTDGINYKSVAAKKSSLQADQFGQFMEGIHFDLPNTAIRSIRFEVKNRGKCPPGHLGAGEKSWIFLDEIELF